MVNGICRMTPTGAKQMRRPLLVLAVLLGCGSGGNALATHDVANTSTFVTAKSLDTGAGRQAVDAVAQQAINDATAAAVIGTLATQLHDKDVQFKLGKVDSTRVSLRDLSLDGYGLIRLAGATSWLPIRFQALYDTDRQTVESPTITFEPAHGRASLEKPLATQPGRADGSSAGAVASR